MRLNGIERPKDIDVERLIVSKGVIVFIDFVKVNDPKLDTLLKSEDALKHQAQSIKKKRNSLLLNKEHSNSGKSVVLDM